MKKKVLLGISLVFVLLLFTSVFANLYYFDIGEFIRSSRENTQGGGGTQSMLATPSQFEINGCGQGTVLDKVTNICWQRNWSSWRDVDGTTLNWTESVQYCDELPLAQKTDWSLPNITELRRLMPEHNLSLFSYYGSTNNAYWKDLGFQFNSGDDSGGLVWSQTPNGETSAWVVGLSNGDAFWASQGLTYRAVCSRWNN